MSVHSKGKDGKKSIAHKFIRSIWAFPVLLLVVVIILSIFRINGSSMGVYQDFFNGDQPDSHLLAGTPRIIRSDEWVVNTQMSLAQYNNGFQELNKNIGDGADMSLLVDAPYASWSQIFKPHNAAFFILPFDIAFAFKWWIMGYMLIVGTYFFAITLLKGPRRTLYSILLAIAFFFSPFIQWWYQYITLAPLYNMLFIGAVSIHLLKTFRETSIKKKILLSTLLVYFTVSFALVQYPPFQIPVALAMLLFLVGYLIDFAYVKKEKIPKSFYVYVGSVLLVAVIIIGAFLYSKSEQISTISNTAYPGTRVVTSGGFSLPHLLSNYLQYPMMDDAKAAHYSSVRSSATNQSESSNFILLIPFLLIPAFVLLWSRFRKKKDLSFTTIAVYIGFLGCIAWMLIPGLDIVGKVTLLDKVPLVRLLIGIGLLNLFAIILFVRQSQKLNRWFSVVYSILCLTFLLFLAYKVHEKFPEFIGIRGAILLSIPIPVIIFCLMRGHKTTALIIYVLFSILSSAAVNPLYQGTAMLQDNNVSQAIREVGISNNDRWIIEDGQLQSFAYMNGERSLTGIYEYPQISLWKPYAQESEINAYNRYAHVNFVFTKDASTPQQTTFKATTPDHLLINTSMCSDVVRGLNVKYVLSSATYTSDTAPCATKVSTVTLPAAKFNIYRLQF